MLILCVLGLILVVSSIVFFSSVNKSEAKTLALKRAAANPLVIERIGEPVTAGWLTRGDIKVTNDSGTAELSIPVSGPKGKGTIFASAVRSAGKWELTSLEFAEAGQSTRVHLQ